MAGRQEHPSEVLVAGGGVAALETVLALNDLAGARVRVRLLTAAPEFVTRPLRIGEPFGRPPAQRHSLKDFAAATGAELIEDDFGWLDGDGKVVHTSGGRSLPYDALVIATGARARPLFRHAITIDDARLAGQLGSLLSDIERSRIRSLAMVVPSPMAWPLPIYELALMTKRYADAHDYSLKVTLITSETAPLAIFGLLAADAVGKLLADNGIHLVASANVGVPDPNSVFIRRGQRALRVDRVIAMPQLFGPPAPGVPSGSRGGFIPVDSYCRVRRLRDVYAAGDATDFPVKHGGIAAQQADVVAASIAADAGAPGERVRFQPELDAVLLGGDRPLHLRARFSSEHGVHAHVSTLEPGEVAPKVYARYLAPYLEAQAARRRLAQQRLVRPATTASVPAVAGSRP
jgi:sulfide:quinone oxidoreductase